jgi:hypothetical protein
MTPAEANLVPPRTPHVFRESDGTVHRFLTAADPRQWQFLEYFGGFSREPRTEPEHEPRTENPEV